MTRNEQIRELLSNPDKLKQKKPFTRGAELDREPAHQDVIELTGTIDTYIPRYRKYVVTQEQFMRELDPNCHDVLYDDNIPSICVKRNDGSFVEIKFEKMPVPFQKNIKDKQVLHLTANKLQFTMMDTEPNDTQKNNFITFKQYWDLRNQDGMKNKAVDTQLSYGDVGWLFYFDYKGQIKSRILSYADGYVLCPHNDQNGDRILESVYYMKDDVEYIDSYDDTYMYRHTRAIDVQDTNDDGWVLHEPIEHGFNEIPLITKRGEVAWNNVQNIITSYEILYNIFNGIQRRFGWGILYVKGKFAETAKKIAGNVVLNDNSIEGKGDAKFLTPPTPQGTIDTLNLMLESIQLGSSTTFLLPKDIKTSGDISGIAIQLTQSLDIENALQKVIDWQNVADKAVRLFKYGLSKELVNNGINANAITEFEDLNINAKFKVWRPMNDYEYNQMLASLYGAGLLSKQTGIQKNTESTPDEHMRIEKEDAEKERKEKERMETKMNNEPNPIKTEIINKTNVE